MAYQTTGGTEDGKEDTKKNNADGGAGTAGSAICVMNLKSGDTYTIDAGEGETVRPLGFINGDFVFGKSTPI